MRRSTSIKERLHYPADILEIQLTNEDTNRIISSLRAAGVGGEVWKPNFWLEIPSWPSTGYLAYWDSNSSSAKGRG